MNTSVAGLIKTRVRLNALALYPTPVLQWTYTSELNRNYSSTKKKVSRESRLKRKKRKKKRKREGREGEHT